MDKIIYAYRIPDIYFRPHKVIRSFYAKVVYSIEDGKPKIEEIAFSDNCLDYLSGQSLMIQDIRKKLNAVVAGQVNNNNVHPTVLNSMAHFIRP